MEMTLSECKRRRNAGEDIHLTKFSADVEMMEAVRAKAQPAAERGTAGSNVELFGGSITGGSRSMTTQCVDHGTLDEDTGCTAQPPSKRETDTCHEVSDAKGLVALYESLSSAY